MIKDDSDSVEGDSDAPVAAATTAADHPFNIDDFPGGGENSQNSSAIPTEKVTKMLSNLSSGSDDSLQDSIIPSEVLERADPSPVSGIGTTLNRDVDIDEHDVHKMNIEGHNSPSNELPSPENADNYAGVENIHRAGDSLMHDCTNTIDKNLAIDDGIDSGTSYGGGSLKIKEEDTSHDFGVENTEQQSISSRIQHSPQNVDKLAGVTTRETVNMLPGGDYPSSLEHNIPVKDYPSTKAKIESDIVFDGSEQKGNEGKVRDSKSQREVSYQKGMKDAAAGSSGKSTLAAPIQNGERIPRPRKPKPVQTTPLRSAPPDRSSLLTRGMSLFARSSKQVRNTISDIDTNSVVSEITQKSASKENKNSDDLRQHLEESGLLLLRRLIEFLSECPPIPGETGQRRESSAKKKRQRGLTLPASALGWLSTQMDDSCGDAFEGLEDCYRVPVQQLECLQTLFKRVTSVRISGEAWPPSLTSTSKAVNDATTGKKTLTNNLLSKFSGEQSIGGDSRDDESCTTTPSRVTESIQTELVVSPFQRYYHELQYNPDINMSFFPNATKVVIDGIPPNWVKNLDSLQKLDMFQMEKGCILDVNQLFFPSDTPNEVTAVIGDNPTGSLGLRRDLSLIDEGKEKEGSSSQGGGHKQGSPSPFVYSSLSKLRLSNCAMGEAAGLLGRRAPQHVPRLPTFSRFPNLVSLNLSQNELFKTKTVFAGLSSLPLLSSIDLSYNRLSRMDDIFMHIGNVTELILTGNEITSTHGLDRLFSLERLSLDENNIHNLANIAGIAKIPFLMNFDIRGNPLEADDPPSCRIKVFNLFREVRCNNLPKNATFRDMQRLLPVLDNDLATKDELVALKDLTFRTAVVPVDSIMRKEDNIGETDSRNIDDSSEISINMPGSSGGIRRIVKDTSTNTAHLRMAGSSLLEEKASGYSKKDGQNDVGVQFNMKDLIMSIRPEIDKVDAPTLTEKDSDSCSGVHREMSTSSLRSKGKDAITVGSTPEASFPFSLPSSLLAEADDDVWNPSSLLDLIPPSETIVWDVLPSDENNENKIAQNDRSIECDYIASGASTEDQTETHADPHDGDASLPLDVTQLPSVNPGQETSNIDDISAASNPDQEETEATDLDTKKSMFDGIWEQTYRDNVTRKNEAVLPTESTEEATPDLLDFNAAEENCQYDGPSDYGPLFVSSDLDLYFDSFIFHSNSSEDDSHVRLSRTESMAPRIQLFKFDRDQLLHREKEHGAVLHMATDLRERYIGVWKLDVMAMGPYAQGRLSPMKIPKRGFHGDIVTSGGKDVVVSESRKFILCLSDSALYFIIDDDISPHKSGGTKRSFPSRIPPNSTFSDAQWPHAVIRHPLDCLSGITIGFQFQRLILRFSVFNATSSTSLDYTYVVLTSNKLQTVSFLQKVQLHITDDTRPGLGAVIDNDDKTFLDALGTPQSNEDALHYQIVHQIWKRGDREASRRSFVLTDAKVYLLDETYTGDGTKSEDEYDTTKKLGDVSMAIVDSARLHRVTEVRAANEDPRKITLVILPQNKLKRSHRWRLVCNDGEGAERLIDDVRRAIRMLA